MARSMVASAFLLVLAGFQTSQAWKSVSVADEGNSANPVRRVVTMLQSMSKKIESEGVKEKALYEKYMCYCKTSGADLQAAIDGSSAEVPELQSSIEAAESKLSGTKASLKQAEDDRADAKQAMSDATAQREKENAVFVATETEYKGYLGSLSKAIPAIEKGMSGTFLLQSRTGAGLKQAIAGASSISDYDRQLVTSFLMGGSSYAPASGEIVGILKQIEADFQKSLDDVTTEEKSAAAIYDELMAAKEKQVKTLSAAIEEKTKRIGELGVEIVNMKADLSETEKKLIEDQKFLAEMDTSCATKTKEWEERVATRSEEILAIQETIKVLNDDESLELFKKTLPSASFIQVDVGKETRQARTRDLVESLRKSPRFAQRPELGFLAFALTGKKVDFSKVMKMIDDMIGILKQEQLDDNHKKEYCEQQFDTADDKVKSHAKNIEKLEMAIADAKESIGALEGELKALAAGIVALDKSVAEASETRRAENSEYTELMSMDKAAKELLEFAKNRLNKFYNPDLYEKAPERVLTEEEKLYVAGGGVLETTTTIPGIAGTGITISALVQVSKHEQKSIDGTEGFEAPPPPPATWNAYQKKGGESSAVLTFIDRLIKDLAKEMTEATVDEKASQKAYEEMMGDAAMKRQADSKAINAKETAKADLEAQLTEDSETKSSEAKQLFAVKEYEGQLHKECDWLVQNFDLRKQARADEMESLASAKAVLAGADFAFVQKGGRQRVPARALRGA